MAQVVRNPHAMQETGVWSLGQEDPLEEEMATHPSALVWKIPWTEEPGGLWSIGLQRVRHNWAQAHTYMCICKPLLVWKVFILNSPSISQQWFSSLSQPKQWKIVLTHCFWSSSLFTFHWPLELPTWILPPSLCLKAAISSTSWNPNNAFQSSLYWIAQLQLTMFSCLKHAALLLVFTESLLSFCSPSSLDF